MGIFGDWFSKALYDAGIDAPGARAYAIKKDEKLGGVLANLYQNNFAQRNQAAMQPYQANVDNIANSSLETALGAALGDVSDEEKQKAMEAGKKNVELAREAQLNFDAAQQVYGSNPMDALQGLSGRQILRAMPTLLKLDQNRVGQFEAGRRRRTMDEYINSLSADQKGRARAAVLGWPEQG